MAIPGFSRSGGRSVGLPGSAGAGMAGGGGPVSIGGGSWYDKYNSYVDSAMAAAPPWYREQMKMRAKYPGFSAGSPGIMGGGGGGAGDFAGQGRPYTRFNSGNSFLDNYLNLAQWAGGTPRSPQRMGGFGGGQVPYMGSGIAPR